MKTSLRRAALPCALLAGTAFCALLATPAAAQTAREFRQPDGNGVDLVHGDFIMAFTEGSIGSGAAELALVRENVTIRPTQWDDITFRRMTSGSTTRIFIGRPGLKSDTFTNGVADKANGGTISGVGSSYTYTAPDGTTTTFVNPVDADMGSTLNLCSSTSTSTCHLLPQTITSPNGATVTLGWRLYSWGGTIINGQQVRNYDYRIQSIDNSYGYGILFTYQSNALSGGAAAPTSWYSRTVASFWKDGVQQASLGYAYPSTGTVDITDTAGQVWRVTATSIRRAGETNPGFVVSGTTSAVTAVTRDGVTTSYSRTVSGNTATVTKTDPLSQTVTAVSDLTTGRPTSVTDSLGRSTSYTYDTAGRLTRITQPEGNYVQFTLDARGNVTQTQQVAKSGSGLATITTSAAYPSTCSNANTCNSPTSTTDARGNVTDYTYDSTHGGVLTVTAPAPSSGAVRPQTRYGYTLVNGEYQVTSISVCQTSSSCTGGADEAKTTVSYDSNGYVASVTRANGTGTLSATAAATYDSKGDILTLDGPLSGTADTVRFRYDSARRRIGTVSPDPDASGALKHRAVKTTYNSSGLPTKVERGTVNSQSDSDWAAFSAMEAVETDYNANFRPTTSKLIWGGSTHALTQTGYDALGRVECSAQRMNPAAYGSLPTSACSLGTAGTHGSDRISKRIYDAAGQVTEVRSAVGTSLEAADVTATYSSNGKAATVTDGESNKTTYEYDGHDRLVKARFPSTTKGAAASSTTDYEEYGYDAAGNLTSRRLRDAQTMGMTYDGLGRLTSKDLPGSEPDVSYGYDLLGRTTSAAYSGHTLSFTYDAFGRLLTQGGPHGTTTSTFDILGRRTRITHADGFYVDQDFLVTGEQTAIRENGATSGVGVLASYAYDDLGRRTSLTRGNGSVESYGYDAVSRLATLGDDLSGTSHDQTLGFSYNPASQTVQNTRSNDSFAWNGHYNINRNYTANGLNQYTASGSVTPTYDTRGNLTSAGPTTYGYSSENMLTSASGGIALSYDPMLRLYQTSGGSAGTTRLAYDGIDLIAEYNGSNAMLRRYVHGPGTDDALVWYEGSGTTDRRFLHKDERGSVTAVTDSSGGVIAVNAYDEYGIPKPTNLGRFQYTGQTWLPELGMYNYKARIYSPSLGRFLQTDPIGYGDGMNMYAYVGGDPVNWVDPTGMNGCGLTNEEEPTVCGGLGGSWSLYIDIRPKISLVGVEDLDLGGSDGGDAASDEDQIVVTANSCAAVAEGEDLLSANPPPLLQAAWTRWGDTKGNNPRVNRNRTRINTDLPGGWGDATAVLIGLARLAGEPGIKPGGLLDDPWVLQKSENGSIQLRIGIDYRGKQLVNISPRIDIKPNTFQLGLRETIHFRGGKGNMCPTR